MASFLLHSEPHHVVTFNVDHENFLLFYPCFWMRARNEIFFYLMNPERLTPATRRNGLPPLTPLHWQRFGDGSKAGCRVITWFPLSGPHLLRAVLPVHLLVTLLRGGDHVPFQSDGVGKTKNMERRVGASTRRSLPDLNVSLSLSAPLKVLRCNINRWENKI